MSRTLLRLLTLGATALTLALFAPAGVFASPL